MPQKQNHNPFANPETPAPRKLVIDVPSQTLRLMRGKTVQGTFPISTSKFGLGTEPGSYRTPTGRFVISEKIGSDAPERTIFESRQPIGVLEELGGESDLILTRILWLSGVDAENANTHDRYIYIHGTNQEAQIGTPASHGCVRMRNADIQLLFNEVEAGTPVEILS